jgi:Putative peptidoglycan binding domain/L,D-transpeptidase catalytic domain
MHLPRAGRRRRAAIAGLLCSLLAATAAGCTTAGSEESEGASTPEPPTAPSTASTTTTTLPPTTLPPPTTTTTTPPPPPLPVFRRGSEHPFVALIQQRLTEWGFRPGPVDGSYSDATFAAVMAFQKHEGIDADGHAGPQTFAAFQDGLNGAGPRGGSAPRIEIDVERQIAFAISADGATRIINVSSGNGERYAHPEGGVRVADTPRGSYDIERRIDGVRVAPLGRLYRPLYFKGGFAIHGSSNVPGYPASHGCVRTTNPDQDYLFEQFDNGTPVEIYPA